jgi:glycosyltransferase involved in cell wall biosynthesis
MEQVRPDAVYFHKVPRLPSPGGALGRVRAVRMVHDHDLCCPRRHKYLRGSQRVCRYSAGWRCWLDGAFLERQGGGGLGWVSIGERLGEMRRNRGLDALLVGSRFMREELLQNGFPRGKVFVLPPITPAAPRPPSPVPEAPEVLYVGQLVRGKGVDLLLRALQRLSCDFAATIVGTGNAQDGLKALCRRLGLARRVRFAGWVDHQALGEFYLRAKVVAVPSRWPEPFGMVGLEAMGHGRPVVGFAVGGIPDWLEHGTTGLLVPERDIASLAGAIERVLSDTAFARTLGENARTHARERYSFSRYLDLVETLLSGPPAAAADPGQGGDHWKWTALADSWQVLRPEIGPAPNGVGKPPMPCDLT